jgi:fatty-acyl-CoA synthase
MRSDNRRGATEGDADRVDARPSHVEVVESGALPLNRVAENDYVVLKERAQELAENLRRQGKWDRRAPA